MPSYDAYNFKRWRQRAEEFRELANSIKGSDAKDTMVRIAQHYDRLAAWDTGLNNPTDSSTNLPPIAMGIARS